LAEDMNQRTIHKIKSVLAYSPVEKAWVFGSFAKNKLRKDSDIDILVQFIPNVELSLFDLGRIVYRLEEKTGRKIDLIQDGLLKPCAQTTADKEKVLIYERAVA
jgi:predicted nucleotidyltransferase